MISSIVSKAKCELITSNEGASSLSKFGAVANVRITSFKLVCTSSSLCQFTLSSSVRNSVMNQMS